MPIPYLEEKEAKTLWCPYARTLFHQSHHSTGRAAAGYNRSHREYEKEPVISSLNLCVGSKCAKWDREKKFSKITGKGRCGA